MRWEIFVLIICCTCVYATGRDVNGVTNTTNQQEVTREKRLFGDVLEDGRKHKKPEMFEKMFPMFVIPYLVQSAMLPAMLISIKFMLLKTFIAAKIAIILMVLNAFRKSTEPGGNEHTNQLLAQNYGYRGTASEIGAWINH